MFRVAIKEHWSSFNKFWLAEALDYISRAGGIVAIRIIGAAETHSLSFSLVVDTQFTVDWTGFTKFHISVLVRRTIAY
jgi:hypothetical protein